MVAEPNYSNVSGKERSGLKRDSLDRMRLRLSEGHPVILSMLVGKRMMLMKPGDTYNESVHQTGEVNTPGTGGHAMVITGYDDRKAAFRILNSWGQSWADGGYGWVSYDAVLADARYAMVMDVDASSYLPRPVPTRPSTPASPLAKNYNLTCADIEESKDEVGKPVITGFVSKQAHKVTLDARLRELNIGSNLKVRPWPICEAMLTLREPLRSLNGPKIELTGGERKLKVKEKFSFTVTPPGFPSYLYVFYVEDDGTVVNLAPRSGPIRQQTEANSEPLIFGDGQSGRATFTVTQLKSVDVAGEPRLKGERGHEAVIVIAARAPIQELEEREDQAKPGAKIYRASAAAASQDGPQDRLFLSLLKDIVFKRADPQALPREVAAAMLHLRIEE